MKLFDDHVNELIHRSLASSFYEMKYIKRKRKEKNDKE